MAEKIETVEASIAPNDSPKYSEQAPAEAVEAEVAPLREIDNDNWDTLDVPRRKRSGEDLFFSCMPKRRPGTAWYGSSQLSGPLPTYSGYASPDGTAPFGPAGSLKAEDEEEIAAALFDLAQTSHGARSGHGREMDESLILPSSRKRPRKPPRAGIKYETNYDDPFDEDWDAEDEYLAKRRGAGRPMDNSGYPGAYNNGGRYNYGYQQAPAPMSTGPRFKPGPNHVAISHFIQWHRRQMKAPPQHQQQQRPPPFQAPSSQAAALAAALARAQGVGMRPPGTSLDVSAIAALLPAGLRQGSAPPSAPPPPAANPLAGMLGQLIAGKQARGQMSPEAMNLLQQLICRQKQQPPLAHSPVPQGQPNVAASFAAVLARLKNAQAKAQGVAMAAAATKSRPPAFQNGQQQQQQAPTQPPTAVLQNLRALLASNAQRSQQQGIPVPPAGQLPPSHTDLMKLMKQSLEIANSNPGISALVAKQQQQQQQVPNGTSAGAAPATISATPAKAVIPTLVASAAAAAKAEPGQVKTENGAEEAPNQKQQDQPATGEGTNNPEGHIAAVELANDQMKENVGLPPSVPDFQPAPTGALDALRAFLLKHQQTVANPEANIDATPKEGDGDTGKAAEEANNSNIEAKPEAEGVAAVMT